MRSARVLIEHHGDDASVAAMRADEWLHRGNIDGFNLWCAIVKAIRVVQSLQPTDGEATH